MEALSYLLWGAIFIGLPLTSTLSTLKLGSRDVWSVLVAISPAGWLIPMLVITVARPSSREAAMAYNDHVAAPLWLLGLVFQAAVLVLLFVKGKGYWWPSPLTLFCNAPANFGVFLGMAMSSSGVSV